MVILVLILLIPVGIGLTGLILGKGQITLLEFGVLELAVVLIVGSGMLIARSQNTWDNEIWSGRVVSKQQVRVSCSHPYQCNPHPCGDKGKSTCYDTCYEHSCDYDWVLTTSNGEHIEIDRVDRQGTSEPPRFTSAKIGDATAISHSYTNYIKASPWSVLRKDAIEDSMQKMVPNYPIGIRDYHYCDRFVTVGVNVQDKAGWNAKLQELNADLGKKKQVNIVIIVVSTNDPSYQFALEQAWIGGKKNDLIVLVGSSQYPTIDWVRIVSWSQSEDLKVEMRDSLQNLGNLELKDQFLEIVRQEVDSKFTRRPMAEFEYLMAAWEPSGGVILFLFLLGIIISGGLTWFFYVQDPFESGEYRYRHRYGRNFY